MHVGIASVDDIMIYKIFETKEDMEIFVNDYKVSEVIILIDSIARYHVWVDELRTICPECKKPTKMNENFCRWCGNPMVKK